MLKVRYVVVPNQFQLLHFTSVKKKKILLLVHLSKDSAKSLAPLPGNFRFAIFGLSYLSFFLPLQVLSTKYRLHFWFFFIKKRWYKVALLQVFTYSSRLSHCTVVIWDIFSASEKEKKNHDKLSTHFKDLVICSVLFLPSLCPPPPYRNGLCH